MMMRNCALPTGPYDWHPDEIPLALYTARLASLGALLQQRDLTGVILTGSTFDDGALAWLTGFTPKLGPAFAIVVREGEPRLLFSGGATMRPSAQKLTWLENVTALRGLAADLADLRLPPSDRWGLVEDAGFSFDNCRAITTALGSEPIDVTPSVDHLRQRQEPALVPLIRHGGEVMRVVERVLRSSTGTRWAARLAAERAAYAAGAQDLRVRLSRRSLGPAEPVDPGPAVLPDSAHAAVAVRVHGYWLCGRTSIGTQSSARRQLWDNLASRLSAGSSLRSVIKAVEPARVNFFAFGHSLVERPLDLEESLSPGQCVSVELAADSSSSAGLTVLIEITPNAPRIIWYAAPLGLNEQVS